MEQEINYALDPTQVVGQPTVEVETETGVSQEVTQEIEGNDPQSTPSIPTAYNIEGLGEVTPEQIKEWYQGHLRQSD